MQHIEGYYVDEISEAEHLEPQPHGGALRRGVHGLGFRTQVTPRIRELAAEVREVLAYEYPSIDLELPTVELFCIAMGRALGWAAHIAEYTEGSRTRRVKGVTLRGYDAVPPYMFAEEARAQANAAKFAQDLGLDLTGRVKALKDEAIRRSLNGAGSLTSFAAEGRKLRQLRGRSA